MNQMCRETKKGAVQHLPACLWVSVVALEAINDDKHLTRCFYFHLLQKFRHVSPVRRSVFLHLFLTLATISSYFVPRIVLGPEAVTLKRAVSSLRLWNLGEADTNNNGSMLGNSKCGEDGVMISDWD